MSEGTLHGAASPWPGQAGLEQPQALQQWPEARLLHTGRSHHERRGGRGRERGGSVLAEGGLGSSADCQRTGWLPGEGAAVQCQQCRCRQTCQWKGLGGRPSHTGPLVPLDEPADERTGQLAPVGGWEKGGWVKLM